MNTQQLADILDTEKESLEAILGTVIDHFKRHELDDELLTDDMVMMICDTQFRILLRTCHRLTTLYKLSPETRHSFRVALDNLLKEKDDETSSSD